MDRHIPTEIADSIIDVVASNTRRYGDTTLSAIALSGRSLRVRTNFHRFSKIQLFINGTPAQSLCTLNSVLRNNNWPLGEGLIESIRTVVLLLGPASGRTALLHETSQDKSIASILSLIFQGKKHRRISPYTSIVFGSDIRCNFAYRDSNSVDRIGYPFTMISESVVAAILKACSGQRISTLSMQYIWNVPMSFIRRLSATRLIFNNVHLVGSGAEITTAGPYFQHLKDLEVISSPAVLGTVLESSPPAIHTIKYWLSRLPEYDSLRLAQVGRLPTFVINLDRDLEVPSSIPGRGGLRLDVSKCLRFEYRYEAMILDVEFIPHYLAEDLTRQPLFLNILYLMPTVLPPVIEMSIYTTICYYPHPDTATNALDHIYARIYHQELVEYLEQQCALTGASVVIELVVEFDFRGKRTYDPNILSIKSGLYFQCLLSRLDSISGVVLNIIVIT